MTLQEKLKANREEILRLAAEHGARNVRVFGSVARGEAGPDSDVDFLVEMAPERNYFDLVDFWQALEDVLGCKVDVITDGGISPYLQEQIYREAIRL